MSIIAWYNSWLNIMFFFAKSLRMKILLVPMLILSMASVLTSSLTASICETLSVISSFLRVVAVSMSGAICPSFPGLLVTSVEVPNRLGTAPECP